MHPKISWYIQDYVILWEYFDNISLDDVLRAHVKLLPLLRSVNHPVHAIIDLKKSESLSFDMHDVASISVHEELKKLEWVVYVGKQNSLLYRTIADALSSVRGTQLRWFETRADALAFLQEVDDSIPE